MTGDDAGAAGVRLLILVTGTGRSGTSTLAGALHHAGLHVPGPHLGANRSNPKGFFESRWSIDWHQQITAAARINDYDSRPGAFELARAAVTPELRDQLRDFLATESEGHDQLVVKDPRSVWAQAVWREVAAEVGLDIRYVTMLRPPAEVVGSRATYYTDPRDEAERRRFETYSVARWVNSSLISERETRGQARAFVPYADLLGDWRPVLTRLGEELGLRYSVDPTSPDRTEIDEFIDPGLRRHSPGWGDLHVPPALRTVADRVWQDLEALVHARGTDPAAEADLDLQQAAYAELFGEAAAIAHDAGELRPPDQITRKSGRKRKPGTPQFGKASETPRARKPKGERPPRLDQAATSDLWRELRRRLTPGSRG